MNFIMKAAWSALLLAPAIGLAMPASAFPLADPSELGSVIVYPKWRSGTVSVNGVTLPQTEIELGAVCPVGQVCAEKEPIKVRFHWVCGGSDKIDNKYICPSSDFDVFLTVDGKAVFDPENKPITGSQNHHVSLPPLNIDGTPCTRGYLIGYAEGNMMVLAAGDRLIFGVEHRLPVHRQEDVEVTRRADVLIVDFVGPATNPVKPYLYRLVLEAQHAGRAHGAELDLGLRQGHAVDRYRPRSPFGVDDYASRLARVGQLHPAGGLRRRRGRETECRQQQ